MRIELQCCTLEQAKKLKELGVKERHDNGRLVSILYFGAVNIYPDDSIITVLPTYVAMSNEELENSEFSGCAFTTSELGVMLPEGCSTTFSDGLWSCAYKHSWVTRIFKAQSEAAARTELLIYLLENGHTTAIEVNQRLAQ